MSLDKRFALGLNVMAFGGTSKGFTTQWDYYRDIQKRKIDENEKR